MTTKIKFILFAAIAALAFSCGNGSKPASNQQTDAIADTKALNFDNVLKCHAYSYNDGYFMTADYGCIYNPNGGNTLGNAVVYLVPQKDLNVTDDQIAAENKKVNALNADQYKKDYNIYIFLIDKKYLNYSKDGDPVYYQKDKFTEVVYTYDNASGNWNAADSVSVNGDPKQEQTWRDNFLSNVTSKPKQQATTATTATTGGTTVADKWFGTYEFNIDEDHPDWRDMQKISLTISKDSVVYHAEGYQIDQTYLLSATDNGSSLKLQYKSPIDNTESAVLDKTKDFGTFSNDGKTYKWVCPYIDISFGSGKSMPYKLNKK
ncbi:hypothetical protein D0C36_23745 [Mucilaginibacter conchicola]|uniref:Lipoprotein n=1 Tax=Mucilaginibacter conchicola TaxID=2303333 RepID=A0A372NM07_9SPHI|nr:hypothetical protein [Mucilaginibacter conchicola]RFZ89974.1 hypothetical protein D0C36_23745 [Mucilaginibacter conchicola]